MIVKVNQKEYSTHTMKFVRTLKGALNKADVAVSNAGLRVGNAIKGTKGPAASFRFKPKSSTQLGRETLGQAKKVNNAITSVAANPGKAISSGVGFVVENPISAAAIPTPAPTLLVNVGENGLKKKFPAYKRLTTSLRKGYDKRVAPVVENTSNTIINYAKMIPA